MSFALGNGRRVLFWRDKWCGIVPLNVAFPFLYVIVASKKALVTNVWSLIMGGGVGILRLNLLLNDWENEELSNLFLNLTREKFQLGLDDKVGG